MKSYFTKKEQIVILISVGVIVSIVGFKFFSSKFVASDKPSTDIVINADKLKDENTLEDQEVNEIPKETPKETHIVQEAQEDIIVHVSGQVKNPGIVELESGKRLMDAVEILGGLTSQADGDRINLAKKLQDEEKIYIPKIGEEVELSLIQTLNSTDEVKTEGTQNSQDRQGTSNKEDTSDKIDINICTKEILNTLPGIGEVLSGRIIEYRETTLFTTIEDIMNVSGIGDKKFEGIKNLITVK